MEAKYLELDRTVETEKGELARVLQGRTLGAIRSRVEEVKGKIASLKPEVDKLAERAMAETALTEARGRIAVLELEAVARENSLNLLRGELGALEKGEFDLEMKKAATDAAIANNEVHENADFRLAPEERIAHEKRVKELESLVSDRKKNLGRLEGLVGADADLANRIAEREEALTSARRRLEILSGQVRTHREILSLIGAARKIVVADLSKKLPELTGKYLGLATHGRHEDVRAEDLAFQVWSSRKGAPLEADEFSRGTLDQFYLAIRLAFMEALFSEESPPMLLDDPLVHADPARRRKVMEMLAQHAQQGQVLLFTCHDFAEYGSYPVLAL